MIWFKKSLPTNEERIKLKALRRKKQRIIRDKVKETGSKIILRTKVSNRKNPLKTVEEEQKDREDVTKAQIEAWTALLPGIIKKLSFIPDPRRPKSVKHKVNVLMIYGLLMFLFRLKSRRSANEHGSVNILSV